MMRFSGICALGAVLAGTLASGQARAQDAPVIAAVRPADPAASKAAAFVRYHVRRYLEDDERFTHVSIDRALGAQMADNAAKAFEVSASMVQKGREAYDSLELDQSIDLLEKAIKRYERHVNYLESPRPISEALIALGAAYILRGEERTGKKILKKAVLADALAKPDTRIFNPSMMEIFHDAQDEALNSPRSSINVISSPSYGEVYLDGKFIGVTPFQRAEIPSGRHYLRIAMDGHVAWGKALDLEPHAEEPVSGTLKPLPTLPRVEELYNKAIARIDEEKPHPAVRELAAFFNAEQVFLATVKLDGERVTVIGALFDIEMDTRVKRAETSFLFDTERFEESVRAFMEQNFGRSTVYKIEPVAASGGSGSGGSGGGGSGGGAGPSASAAPVGGVGAEVSIGTIMGFPARDFKLYLTLSLAGTGGTLAIVGGILGGLALSTHGTWGDTPQPLAGPYADSGRTKALAGDILIGGGLALATAAGLVWMLWDPAPSASEQMRSTSGPAFGSLGLAPLPGGGALMTLGGSL